LAELLKSIAISLSKEQEVSLEQKKILLQQQSRISEYIQYIKENKDQPMQVTSYPLKKEQELIQYISKGQKAEAQRLLNEILGYVFFASGQDFNVIKLRTLELLVLLSRAAINGGADVEEIFGLNYKYINLLDNFKTIEELTFWLSKIMFRFTDLVFDLKEAKHADLIHKALRYIQSNYQGKITLEEVATLVNLSPSYFSKVFKEGMNCSFTGYLNRYRIDQSKLLLKTTAIPLSEIGALVGFEDQSYFTKIFKKNTGMLPGKYRRSNLSIFQNTPEIRN
jgi:YesN/AraC family two-component response regulator